MRIFNIFRKSAPDPRGSQEGYSRTCNSYNELASFIYGYETKDYHYLYCNSATFATAIDKIADGGAGIIPVLYQDEDIAEDQTVLKSLSNPKLGIDRTELIKTLIVDLASSGACYLVLFGNIDFEPAYIQPAPSCDVSLMNYASDGGLQTIVWTRKDGRQFEFNRDPSDELGRFIDPSGLIEIVQINDGIMKKDGITPVSKADSVLSPIYQQIYGDDHNNNLLKNGATLSGILTVKPDGNISEYAQKESMDELSKKVSSTMTGTKNAGRVIVSVGETSTFAPLTANNKDMDFAVLMKRAEERIYIRYNIPLALVTSENQTMNNLEVAVARQYYNDAVLPYWNKLMEGIARCLFPRYKIDRELYHIDFDPNSIEALHDSAIERSTRLTQSGLISTNEARSMIGRDPVEGGDDIRITANEIPLSDLGVSISGGIVDGE